MENLEQKINPLYASLAKKTVTQIKQYAIDTSASIAFYTPLLASSEYFIAGMSTDKVFQSRLYAAGIHALTTRIYGKIREQWANTWHADPSSTWQKKLFVDSSISVLFQIPVYSTILYASGASSEEIITALPSGLLIGLTFGRGFGYFLDTWRGWLGGKPTLKI